MFEFIKKIWHTGDTVLPEDLNRYEEGIYNNKQKIGNKAVSEQIEEHNISDTSHEDIRDLIPVIADDLTTQDAKKAFSALQGYLLSQQITVLSIEKLNTIVGKSGSVDDADLQFGVYRFSNATGTLPEGYTNDNDFILYVNRASSFEKWGNQILIDVRNNGDIFKRKMQSGVFGKWESMATTDKSFTYMGAVMKDYNQVIETGFYHIFDFNYSNKPPFGYGFLEVIKTDGVFIKQIATDVATSKQYVRTRTESAWMNGGKWVEVATTDKIDILWNGNASTGTITLSSVLSNYNYLIFTYSLEGTFNCYTIDKTPYSVGNGKYYIPVDNGKIEIQIAGQDISILTANRPLARIVGVKRGGL